MTKKDDIIKLIEASGMLKQTQQVMDLQLEALKVEDEEVYAVIKEHKVFEKIVEDDLKPFVIELYDKYFNENQVKKLREVYEDPDMQKMIKDAPKIFQEVNAMMQEIVQKRLNELPDESFPDDDASSPD